MDGGKDRFLIEANKCRMMINFVCARSNRNFTPVTSSNKTEKT